MSILLRECVSSQRVWEMPQFISEQGSAVWLLVLYLTEWFITVVPDICHVN